MPLLFAGAIRIPLASQAVFYLFLSRKLELLRENIRDIVILLPILLRAEWVLLSQWTLIACLLPSCIFLCCLQTYWCDFFFQSYKLNGDRSWHILSNNSLNSPPLPLFSAMCPCIMYSTYVYKCRESLSLSIVHAYQVYYLLTSFHCQKSPMKTIYVLINTGNRNELPSLVEI